MPYTFEIDGEVLNKREMISRVREIIRKNMTTESEATSKRWVPISEPDATFLQKAFGKYHKGGDDRYFTAKPFARKGKYNEVGVGFDVEGELLSPSFLKFGPPNHRATLHSRLRLAVKSQTDKYRLWNPRCTVCGDIADDVDHCGGGFKNLADSFIAQHPEIESFYDPHSGVVQLWGRETNLLGHWRQQHKEHAQLQSLCKLHHKMKTYPKIEQKHSTETEQKHSTRTRR